MTSGEELKTDFRKVFRLVLFDPRRCNWRMTFIILFLCVGLLRLRSGDERPAVTDPLRDGERGGCFLVFCLLHGPDGEFGQPHDVTAESQVCV